MDDNDLALLEKLGLEGVLAEMAKGEGRLGRPGSSIREEISHWIELKRTERALESSALRDAREEETLKIAKRSNIIAISSIIFSIITAAIIAVYTVKYGK